MNQLNENLNKYQTNIGQVKPTPEPATQNPEHLGDEQKEGSVWL